LNNHPEQTIIAGDPVFVSAALDKAGAVDSMNMTINQPPTTIPDTFNPDPKSLELEVTGRIFGSNPF